ncbi:putative RNA uridine N3 methyltransferase [Aeropyrum camini]|uniref:putative RNA uridine N3 methyltransferase n=1 Tax=Aeropyrum camini TaxID=229980 RepID=UPI0012E32040|nr:putative RNA uridine N3 methyltransferase [Aeropyrum camini]
MPAHVLEGAGKSCLLESPDSFGGPYRGVLEYTSPSLYDGVVNVIPHQGTETVRTEEALHATLEAVNVLESM